MTVSPWANRLRVQRVVDRDRRAVDRVQDLHVVPLGGKLPAGLPGVGDPGGLDAHVLRAGAALEHAGVELDAGDGEDAEEEGDRQRDGEHLAVERSVLSLVGCIEAVRWD